MNLHRHVQIKEGYSPVLSPDEGILKYIGFGVLNLQRGDKYTSINRGRETGLIILKGTCNIRAGEVSFQSIGKRSSVFEGRAYAVYVPRDTEFEITAESPCEIAVCTAPSSKHGRPQLITPEQNKIRVLGRENWQRDVCDIIGLEVEAERLVIGETLNPPGNWSSYPPHKHDEDNLPQESKMEELYFFKIEPEHGFGFQRLYTPDGSLDEVYTLRNNDVVFIPRGYHPVVAAPGYKICYLWVLAGEKRILAPNDDPVHAWIKEAK